MRPFLAFDTATDHLALALGDLDAPGAVLAAEDFVARRAANTVLLGAVERLLERAGVAVGELRAVSCGRGPGSFTGVRIGVATAKGIAHGLGVPLVGFGTLDAVAFRTAAEGLLGVVGDAMRGEVYPALFRAAEGIVTRLEADRVVHPEVAAAEWAALGEPMTLTGAGLAKHRTVFELVLGERAHIADTRLWAPDGAALVAVSWAAEGPLSVRAISGLDADAAVEAAHPAALLPVYTRLSDAEEVERVRGGGARVVVPRGGVSGPPEGGRS
jgi:N6-L-threonylcarbamoyladenine synthase